METSPRTYLETNLSPFDSKTWKLECIKQTITIFNALIFSTTSNTRFYYVESMYKLIIWQIIMGFLSSFQQFSPMLPSQEKMAPNGTSTPESTRVCVCTDSAQIKVCFCFKTVQTQVCTEFYTDNRLYWVCTIRSKSVQT